MRPTAVLDLTNRWRLSSSATQQQRDSAGRRSSVIMKTRNLIAKVTFQVGLVACPALACTAGKQNQAQPLVS